MEISVPDLNHDRSLHHDVQAYVLSLIRSGEIAPGQRVSEAEIARRLGISRTPVREASARLIKDGILVHSPRRGVTVAQVSRQSVEETCSLREVIEGFAARRASLNAQPEDLERLHQILEEGVAAGRNGDWLTMEEKNAEFHDILIAASRHSLLSRVWSVLTPLTWKLTPAVVRPGSLSEAVVRDFRDRHARLLQAVASRDPDRAEQEAREHVRKVSRTMTEEGLQLEALSG